MHCPVYTSFPFFRVRFSFYTWNYVCIQSFVPAAPAAPAVPAVPTVDVLELDYYFYYKIQ